MLTCTSDIVEHGNGTLFLNFTQSRGLLRPRRHKPFQLVGYSHWFLLGFTQLPHLPCGVRRKTKQKHTETEKDMVPVTRYSSLSHNPEGVWANALIHNTYYTTSSNEEKTGDRFQSRTELYYPRCNFYREHSQLCLGATRRKQSSIVGYERNCTE